MISSPDRITGYKERKVVEFDVITGHLHLVSGELKRRISSFQRGKEKLKVGISVDPETRWTKHRLSQHEWNKMVVIYESSSHDKISQAESELINYSIERFPEKCQNQVSGGGGINEPYLYEKFYLYLLLK